MVTAEGRGEQGSWVLLLSFLLTLGEMVPLPNTQFLRLQNKGQQAAMVRLKHLPFLEAQGKSRDWAFAANRGEVRLCWESCALGHKVL